ncbi:MAG: hypothetical protein KDA60_02440, partial [Planctomycetales bacterium]|nr:hypothetical protein [Planctomycetales bacterium]
TAKRLKRLAGGKRSATTGAQAANHLIPKGSQQRRATCGIWTHRCANALASLRDADRLTSQSGGGAALTTG